MSPNASPAPVTLDAAALSRLRELDPEGRNGVMRRVLATFETSVARTLDQLEADAQEVDAAGLASIAHMLKSSSASVGALRLSAACEQIERAARDVAGPAAREDVERLLAEGRAALVAVRAMVHP
ncbi:MAG: Hpt domain-containing protein [Pseudomonadota bacterium]|jgi:HPt (histidine-containing phosphotransfer) domain-containing protein|nr:Hpt domain-containing protein [Rubrivivax sp.]MCZ8030543.1 Hpt domain-containing protein [Rubrivivax sp.]